jgi:hypothetical protein
MGSMCIAPLILNLNSRKKWVDKFMSLPLSRQQNNPGTHSTGTWKCPKNWSGHFRGEINSLTSTGIQPRTFQPVAHSLYSLRKCHFLQIPRLMDLFLGQSI